MNTTIIKRKNEKSDFVGRFRREAVLSVIQTWRNTFGKKIRNWDEVKTIRAWREQAR